MQIVISSRYEMNFTWAEGFETIELQPLHEENIIVYLQLKKISYPDDQRLRQILQSPMMLTLYANSSEIVEHYNGNELFDFKHQTSIQGELIWNFLEAQLVKLSDRYGRESGIFYYHKLLIRHFLSFLGYEMEKLGYFVFDEMQLLEVMNHACRYFYQKEFIQAYHEFRLPLREFNLKELDFAEEEERFEQISKALYSDLCLMKRERKLYEFLIRISAIFLLRFISCINCKEKRSIRGYLPF